MPTYSENFALNELPVINPLPNQSTIAPNLELSSRYSTFLRLVGAVYDSNFNPLDGAIVVVYDSNGIAIAEATTPLQAGLGGFILTFSCEIRKTYNVSVGKEGYQTRFQFIAYWNQLYYY